MDKENINTNSTDSNVTYMDEVRAKLEQARKDGKLDTGMDELRSVPHRTQEKEGRTPQEEMSFRTFLTACVVTGIVIGLMIVAW